MENLLKETGYKVTPARIAILGIFSNSKNPVTAEKIYSELKKDKKYKDINEATVYRTLTAFLDGGIIRKVDFRKDSDFFELAKEHHHHIACIKCDTIEDFESKKIEDAIIGIVNNSSKFISINEHSLELFGLCKKCKI